VPRWLSTGTNTCGFFVERIRSRGKQRTQYRPAPDRGRASISPRCGLLGGGMRDCPERPRGKEGPSFGSRRVLAIVSARLPITRQRLARVRWCRCRSKPPLSVLPRPRNRSFRETLARPPHRAGHDADPWHDARPRRAAHDNRSRPRRYGRRPASSAGNRLQKRHSRLIGNEARRVADNGFGHDQGISPAPCAKEHELFDSPRVENRSWPSWVERYALAPGQSSGRIRTPRVDQLCDVPSGIG